MARTVSRTRKLSAAVGSMVEQLETRLFLSAGPRQMEYLDRGVIATRASSSTVFVSWRSLVQDGAGTSFNVYRSTNGGTATRLNASPLTGGTNYSDNTASTAASAYSYFVKPVLGGVEQDASPAYTVAPNSPTGPFYTIPLRNIGDYNILHMSVADLNGDGEYDFVVGRRPFTGVGATSEKIEAYLNDGTFLWSIDCGPGSYNLNNIEPGPSAIDVGNWDGVQVYDMDGDGKAEVMYRSADGVVFGDGQQLSYPTDPNVQFISVINGMTGAERARIQVPTDYLSDGPSGAMTGIGYLDGVHPSLIVKFKNRRADLGFNLMMLAYDFDGTNITQKWKWLRGSTAASDGHNLRILDFDGDGQDEVGEIGYVLESDGTLKYSLDSQGIVHGDRWYVGDFDPTHPGLEGYGIQQNNPSMLMEYYYDAATGQVLNTVYGTSVGDAGRGDVGDIDPSYPGAEYWSFSGVRNAETSTQISTSAPWPHIGLYWDGDVQIERLSTDSPVVDKWNPATQGTGRVTTLYHYGSPSSTEIYYGDITGDWREEAIYERSDHQALVIYTTQISSSTRLYTLAQNPQYRDEMTLQGYLQTRNVDYYLGGGMSTPPTPNIQVHAAPVDPNAAPTVATAAAASPTTVTGATTSLSVLGADDGGEANLTYTWWSTGGGDGVSFSANASNAAKSTVATFNAAGVYTLIVTISDAGGRTITSSVEVTVSQTLTSIAIAPIPAVVGLNATQQFSATAHDQFGIAMTTQPTLTWSLISGGGSIDATGLYSSPATDGTATLQAAAGAISGTALVTISAEPSMHGWWKLDETSGTTVSDSSGYGNNATLNGPTRASGHSGSALSFDGSNDYVALPNNLVSTAAGSVALWMKTVANFADAAHMFYTSSVTTGNGGGSENELHVSFLSTEQIQFFIEGGTADVNITTPGAYADDAWHQVVATWDINADATLYVDGVRVGSAVHNANSFIGSAVTYLGRPGASARYYSGLMDDVQLYNNALSATDVRALYDATTNQAPTIAIPAAASPSPVTGTTTALSVLGADDNGEAGLTYTWSATGPAAVTYSANGTNAARNTTATFTAAGSYVFTATIADAGGLSVTSAVNVTVNQALTAMTVSPATATVNTNATQQFTAGGTDQFGAPMTASYTWSVIAGGGTISTAGLYTAPTSAGAATVQAVSGTLTQTALVTIVAPAAPNAPTNLAGTKAGRKVKLTWSDNSTNESGFRVWSSRDGVTWSLMAIVGAAPGSGNTLSYTSGALTSGTWYFKVTSYNAVGDSTASNIVSLLI